MPYFIDKKEPVPAPTQIPPAEATHAETPQTKAPPADVTSIEPAAKSLSVTLASLASTKRGRGRPRKYPEQVNITAPSNICFLMD